MSNFVGNAWVGPNPGQGGPITLKSTQTASVDVPHVNLDVIGYGALPVIKIGATQTVAIGASSAASSAVAGTVVRLVSTVDCFVAFGAATPTASSSGMFLPANVPEYFQFTTSQLVAVIQASVAGNLYVTVAG